MEQFLLLISVGFLFIVIAGFHVYKQQMGPKRLQTSLYASVQDGDRWS